MMILVPRQLIDYSQRSKTAVGFSQLICDLE